VSVPERLSHAGAKHDCVQLEKSVKMDVFFIEVPQKEVVHLCHLHGVLLTIQPVTERSGCTHVSLTMKEGKRRDCVKPHKSG
jgi:hypothetical protein